MVRHFVNSGNLELSISELKRLDCILHNQIYLSFNLLLTFNDKELSIMSVFRSVIILNTVKIHNKSENFIVQDYHSQLKLKKSQLNSSNDLFLNILYFIVNF